MTIPTKTLPRYINIKLAKLFKLDNVLRNTYGGKGLCNLNIYYGERL